MLRGRFGDTSGRPYMAARVGLFSTGRFAEVSFLFDTGADITLLMPMDSSALGVDFTASSHVRVPLNGVGGAAWGVVLAGALGFRGTDDSLYVYSIGNLIAAQPTAENVDVPSLLGRNIMDQWNVNYSPSENTLTAIVRSADFTFHGQNHPTP
jgi:hypothetical protein